MLTAFLGGVAMTLLLGAIALIFATDWLAGKTEKMEKEERGRGRK